ncbi:DUF4465 domain-containing protein [Nostoc sp. CENA67]|uniref:DUF4465 domain-containing protein n=1 Tax=Amazonocrinis nigriterrae CENA67 TaxID=2794033 RepID=A0A8J7HWW8_9NOST|nr:DUF4465 domain-containing protein [Amazonocrinis nigriterrae]MBH8565800.1 DUF4465 domain-containing protein [Amazonocrinis nigriterrae CENA67]
MKINFLPCLLSIGLVSAVSTPVFGQQIVDFEDLNLAPETYYNGSDGAGGFTSQGAFFNNRYSQRFGNWSGWSYSNTTDTTTPGYTNQFSAYTGGGADGSSNYGVAYTFQPGGSAYIDLPTGLSAKSAQITNTTYAVLSMLNGDQFAKKFGGISGNDPDFFRLTITGLDAANATVGNVDFYLADYRFSDNSQDYIVDKWELVDLSSLTGATRLSFSLTTSDNGQFGPNTPLYFALDNLILNDPNATPIPESSLGVGLLLAFATLSGSQTLRKLRNHKVFGSGE